MPCNALMLEFLKSVQEKMPKQEAGTETDSDRSSSEAAGTSKTMGSSSGSSLQTDSWCDRSTAGSEGEYLSDEDEEGSLMADSSSLGVQSSLSTRTVSSVGLTKPHTKGRRSSCAAKAAQRSPASVVVWMENQMRKSGTVVAGASTSSSAENDDESTRRMRHVLTTELWSQHEEVVVAALKYLTRICTPSSPGSELETKPGEEEQGEDVEGNGGSCAVGENALHEMVLLGGHLGIVCAMRAFPRSAPTQMHGLRLLLVLGTSFNRHWLDVLGMLGGIAVAVQALISFPARDAALSMPASSASSSSSTVSSSSSLCPTPRWYKAPTALHSRAYRLLSLLVSTRDNVERFARDADAGWLQVRALLEVEPYDPPTHRLIGRLLRRLKAWEEEVEDNIDGDDDSGSHLGVGLGLAGALHSSLSSLEAAWKAGPLVSSDGSSIKSTATESTVDVSETSNGDENDSDNDEEASGSNAEGSGNVPTRSSDVPQDATSTTGVSVVATASKPKKRVTFAPVPFDEWDCEGDDLSEVSVDDASDLGSSPSGAGSDPESETSRQLEAMFVQSAVHDALSEYDPSDALRTVRETLKRSRQPFARTFLEVGGPLALTQCLVDRLDIKNVQLRGYDVMHQLLKMDGFADVLGDLDAVRIVLEGMRMHPQSETLVKDGCHALFELMSRSQANVDRFLGAEGLPLVLSSLQNFEGRAGVEHRACQVLLASASPPCKPILFELGGAAAAQRIVDKASGAGGGAVSTRARDAAQQVLDRLFAV